MKGRPRRVEREVAAHLSKIFSDIGNTPVERIPVLGRTGPDITWNSIKFIVDVKSRKAVPACMLASDYELLTTEDGLLGFRLDQMSHITEDWMTEPATQSSKTVKDWLDHMNEWTKVHEPDGISAIILHRPGMPIGNSTVIIFNSSRSALCKRLHP